MRHARGFTLIELLVAFALAALMVGLAPLAFERLRESAQYRDTVRSMLLEIRQARSQALTHGAEVRFQLDLAQRKYGIEGRPGRELPPSLETRATVASLELAPGNVAAIRFLPSGGATGGSIDLVRPSGAGVRLQVDWLSGRVSQEPIGR